MKKTVTGLLLFVSLLIASASAQDSLRSETQPAAVGPNYNLSLGYIFHTLVIPGTGPVTLYGLNAGGDMQWRKRWAAAIDVSYIRTSSVSGTGRGGNVASLLLGPTFYLFQDQAGDLFVHVLAGPALANSSTSAGNANSQAWSARFTHPIGAGFEHSFSDRFALRISADYVGKPYVGSSDVVAAVSLVYHLQHRIH